MRSIFVAQVLSLLVLVLAIVLAIVLGGCLPSIDTKKCYGPDGCKSGSMCLMGQCVSMAGDSGPSDATPGVDAQAQGMDAEADASVARDSGAPDAARGMDAAADAGPEDTGTMDVGLADAGSMDATASDAAATDASPVDATAPDAAAPDATDPDATAPDATAPDASPQTLNVTFGGSGTGTVDIAPAIATCTMTCSSNISSGTIVTLTASAAASSQFDGWGGDCSGTAACMLTMDQTHNVTASFTRFFRLSVQVNDALASAGTVTSTTVPINCTSAGGATCATNQPSGTQITLTRGGTFSVFNWADACAGSGSAATCTVTMSSDLIVTGDFSL